MIWIKVPDEGMVRNSSMAQIEIGDTGVAKSKKDRPAGVPHKMNPNSGGRKTKFHLLSRLAEGKIGSYGTIGIRNRWGNIDPKYPSYIFNDEAQSVYVSKNSNRNG